VTGSTPRVLGERYRLDSLLATGGMGQVWRARDVLLDRPVAVKVLRSEYGRDPTFLSRFRAEAHHGAGLVHPNIATLFDYGESPAPDEFGDDLAYLVMELVEGEPLSAVLERERRLDPARTLDLLRQTASALAVAHAAGVVHRDVKPGNVLIGDDGVVRITDFGIAWSASSVPLTLTGQIVGTPQYLPPEQAAGERACPAGDVYALGLIGYECLAGRRAFDGDNPVAIALRQVREEPEPLPPDVPDDVRTLIGRALEKDPTARFPDGAAFRDAVEDVQAGRPLPPSPEPAGTLPFGLARLGLGGDEEPGRRGRARRLLVPVAALVAGAGIAVAGV
jgi:eukaryotic-like serine/threonine-protein kinase